MDNTRRDRSRLLALADRLVLALEQLVAPQPDLAALAEVPLAADHMLVRHLGVEHLGRWISLPGKPESKGRAGIHEPSHTAVGGRLVGYRPGDVSVGSATIVTRKLVILQGPTPVELPVNVGDLVVVSPREWN